jgi:hypothetical protein
MKKMPVPNEKKAYTEFYVQVKRETKPEDPRKGALLCDDGVHDAFWVPKSQIGVTPDEKADGFATVSIPQWLIVEHGLES